MRGIREEPLGRICKLCSKSFFQKTTKPRDWCSYECRQKHNVVERKLRRHAAAQADITNQRETCVVCEKRFVRKVAGKVQLYCSSRCNKKAWKVRHRERHLADTRLAQDRVKFDGNYIPALARDSGRCVHCGVEADTVHHLDNRGDKCKLPLSKNHSLDNLASICDACHRKQHVINWAFDGEALIVQCEAFRPLLGTATVRLSRKEVLI